MNVGYITINKFLLGEKCTLALTKFKSHPPTNKLNSLIWFYNRKLIKQIHMLEQLQHTFGPKDEITVNIELFNKINKLAGE